MSKTNTATQTQTPETNTVDPNLALGSIHSVDPTTVLGSIHHKAPTVDDLKTRVLALDNTSKKIRWLFAHFNEGGNVPHNVRINKTHKLLKEWGVTTQAGTELRYQHVRNIALQPVSSK
jgi:hypothetical protein